MTTSTDTTPEEPAVSPLGSGDMSEVTPEAVIAVALEVFAEKGYSNGKLELIAKRSGMSKRMIHYHFGDKKGLYLQTLTLALRHLSPTTEQMQVDSIVPAEGVEAMIGAIFDTYQQHPAATRLLLMENVYQYAGIDTLTTLIDETTSFLQIDRWLLLGQDSGAFRPGVSAEDIYFLVTALAQMPEACGMTARNLFALDLHSADNREGIHRLMVDAVLSFLTANVPPHPKESYLTRSTEDEPHSAAEIYGFE